MVFHKKLHELEHPTPAQQMFAAGLGVGGIELHFGADAGGAACL